MWDAIVPFVGQSNIAISTGASPEFRQVIQAALRGGFDRALKNPKGDVDQEFKAFCPSGLSVPPQQPSGLSVPPQQPSGLAPGHGGGSSNGA
jgi:hypothetical protein